MQPDYEFDLFNPEEPKFSEEDLIKKAENDLERFQLQRYYRNLKDEQDETR